MAMCKIFFSYSNFSTILVRNVLAITINITFRTFIHEIVFHPVNIRVVIEWFRKIQPTTFSPQIGADYTIFMLFEKKTKNSGRSSGKCNFFSISVYRTLEALKHKSAAALSTIAATFCSIIIETHCTN